MLFQLAIFQRLALAHFSSFENCVLLGLRLPPHRKLRTELGSLPIAWMDSFAFIVLPFIEHLNLVGIIH